MGARAADTDCERGKRCLPSGTGPTSAGAPCQEAAEGTGATTEPPHENQILGRPSWPTPYRDVFDDVAPATATGAPVCRHATTHLERGAYSAAEARRLVARQLAAWEVEDDGTVVLLVSELVTNAIRHASSAVDLTVAVAEGTLEVGVADGDRRPAAVRQPQPDEEGGRGLLLVEELAEEWGNEILDAGKQVWFRLPVDEAWAYATSCRCHGAELHETVRLGSGRRVMHDLAD